MNFRFLPRSTSSVSSTAWRFLLSEVSTNGGFVSKQIFLRHLKQIEECFPFVRELPRRMVAK